MAVSATQPAQAAHASGAGAVSEAGGGAAQQQQQRPINTAIDALAAAFERVTRAHDEAQQRHEEHEERMTAMLGDLMRSRGGGSADGGGDDVVVAFFGDRGRGEWRAADLWRFRNLLGLSISALLFSFVPILLLKFGMPLVSMAAISAQTALSPICSIGLVSSITRLSKMKSRSWNWRWMQERKMLRATKKAA